VFVADYDAPRDTTLRFFENMLRIVAETFGDRLTRLRLECGLSVAELARAVKSSEAAIRHLQSGESKGPYLSVGVRIANALGVSPSYLAFGIDGHAGEAESRSLATVIAEQERSALEIAALNRRVNTLEDRGAGDRPHTVPESR
jgi:transcriptional regulator with XRE-family HTH domain